MRILQAVALLLAVISPVAAESDCSSFPIESEGLDLAPLSGFVEGCSQDEKLCAFLTRGYPSTVHTVGYFFLEDEWARYTETEVVNFSVYFIAQVVTRMSAEDFGRFATFARSRNGVIPDHTELPTFLEKQGQAPLGILGETEDSITLGTVMRIQNDVTGVTVSLASANTALQLPKHTMSLYVYRPYDDASDSAKLAELAERWINCLRQHNQ